MSHFLLKRILVMGTALLLMAPAIGFSARNTADTARKKVDNAITTRQNTQKKQDQWETEKSTLIIEYEQVKARQEQLLSTRKTLAQEAAGHDALVEDLAAQKEAQLQIQREMLPFLKEVYASLDKMVTDDPPFLREERQHRLQKLAGIMDDVEISIAEKYRKIMEALFVEAEYGNTIEVTQDKIVIAGSEVLADVLRLGRISLFALTLDHQSAAVFNVAENRWAPLEKDHLPSVIAAVEMGKKRRTVEILSLPIGQLAN